MNCTQNLKIEQVTDQTLVIGMDIAKQKHYAAIVDARGRVLKKSFSVSQSRIIFSNGVRHCSVNRSLHFRVSDFIDH